MCCVETKSKTASNVLWQHGPNSCRVILLYKKIPVQCNSSLSSWEKLSDLRSILCCGGPDTRHDLLCDVPPTLVGVTYPYLSEHGGKRQRPHSNWLQSLFLSVIITHNGVLFWVFFLNPFDLGSVKWKLFVVATSLRSLFGGHLEPEAACGGTCWGTMNRKAAGWTKGKYCVWAA